MLILYKEYHIHTMLEPTIASWNLSISDSDFKKLKAGFEPQDQDDKWRIWATDERQRGRISIHFSRSGTGIKHYILSVKLSDSGSSSTGVKIEAIIWAQRRREQHIPDDYAKMEVGMIARSILECDFDALPDYSEDLWNHPAA